MSDLTLHDGDRAFTSHGEGTYREVLGARRAPEGTLYLLIERDDGGQQVELWTISGRFVADVTNDPDDR